MATSTPLYGPPLNRDRRELSFFGPLLIHLRSAKASHRIPNSSPCMRADVQRSATHRPPPPRYQAPGGARMTTLRPPRRAPPPPPPGRTGGAPAPRPTTPLYRHAPPVGAATLPRQAAPGPSCASGGCVPFKGKGCGAPRHVRAGRAINCRLNELMAGLMNELQTSVAEETHTELRRPWLRRLWLRKPTRN